MGPVFAQLLYIDCASDPSVQETWEGPKFDELVTKISEHVSQKERKTMVPEEKQTVAPEERKTVAPIGQQSTHHLSNTHSHISPHKDEKQQTTIEDQNTVKGKTTPAPYNAVKENRIDQKQEGRRDWKKRDSKVSIASSTYSEIYGHDAYNSANNDMDVPRFRTMTSHSEGSACCSIL